MAVYTDVDADMLAAFLADYALGEPKALTGILQGIENSNYRLETTTGRYVLTVFERRAALADLPYFLGLMSHLAATGFPAPQPIAKRDGATLGEIAGKPAAIVTFLEGDWPRAPTEADAHAAGGALARLHLAGSGFRCQRANDLGAAAWAGLFAQSADRADDVAPGLKREIEAALDRLERGWPTDLPGGAIHADLFPDNLFLKDGQVSGVIDFYFACDDAYAYDLAITLNAWCFGRDGGWRNGHADAMVAGYEAVRPLTPGERATMPTLLAGAAMRFLLTRLHDWSRPQPGSLQRPKDPLEQLACLRVHLNRETVP